MPSTAVRWLVSVLLIAHFFAILTAITSSSTINFPAPKAAVRASEPMQPYLEFTFLNNAYRFFSPNPGAPTVLWFRIQDQDRTVRWVEVPGPCDSWARVAYQRRLNFTVLLGQHLAPDPAQEGKRRFSSMGQICLESCVRHVAHAHPRLQADGSVAPMKSIGVYCVQHTVITPEQVRAGWEQIDLRTYHATFVGAFTPEGERVDEFRPGVLEQPIAQVVAGILEVDVYAPMRKKKTTAGSKLVEDLALPTPLRRFLVKHPEFLTPADPQSDLKGRIEKLLIEG